MPYLISPMQDDSLSSEEHLLHPSSNFVAKKPSSTILSPDRILLLWAVIWFIVTVIWFIVTICKEHNWHLYIHIHSIIIRLTTHILASTWITWLSHFLYTCYLFTMFSILLTLKMTISRTSWLRPSLEYSNYMYK